MRSETPGRTLKVLLGVVEEQDLDLATVVCVDDTCTRVDHVLARCNHEEG